MAPGAPAGGARRLAGRRARPALGPLHDGRDLARRRSARSSTAGARYGLKVHEFRKFIELPARSAQRVRDRPRHPPRRRGRPRRAARATAGGSSTPARSPATPTRSAPTSRARAPSSRSRRASTSTRDAAGSATARRATWPRAGRRWSRTPASADILPVGDGLVAFRTLEEAVAGAADIAARYAEHAAAARRDRRRSTSPRSGCCAVLRRGGYRLTHRASYGTTSKLGWFDLRDYAVIPTEG